MSEEKNLIECRLDGPVNWTGSTTIYGDIKLYINEINSREHLRKVFLHEIGHFLGPFENHSNRDNDIMSGGWNGVTEYTEHDYFLILGGE